MDAPPPPPNPFKDWAKFSSGLSANQNFSLAPLTAGDTPSTAVDHRPPADQGFDKL